MVLLAVSAILNFTPKMTKKTPIYIATAVKTRHSYVFRGALSIGSTIAKINTDGAVDGVSFREFHAHNGEKMLIFLHSVQCTCMTK